MMKWVNNDEALSTYQFTDEKARTHNYRWKNQVPLHGGDEAIIVNWLEYQIIDDEGKVTYRNSFVTDIEITQNNIQTLVQAGRCRWKIENECFNTLKNQGYHITHNYGHGDQYLCDNMYVLTLLAFYFHQIFELTDTIYQACRIRYGSKAHMWENFRVTVRFLLFDSWEELMDNLLSDPDITEASYYRP